MGGCYWSVFTMFFVSRCWHFNYIIEFLFVKRGDLMSVLSTNHRDHSLPYEHELFSISSKKIFDWTEQLHDNWHFCYVVVSGSSLQTKSDYISIWTSILIKCSVCCVRFIWVICLRLDSITQKYDTVYCLWKITNL